MTAPRRLKLAVWKFSSCDGCQLTLLDCEDELLAIADAVEIAFFLEASRAQVKGPYDLSLVEGSISTPADIKRIMRVRQQSRLLVTIGACACAGGIQALRNAAKLYDVVRAVYPDPARIEALATSTPIQDHVPVDFELRGCPIDKGQLVQTLIALVNGRMPSVPRHSQCLECKQHGTPCVMVTQGLPCLGPVTQAGCGNLCPSHGRACYGCFGPMESPNTAALAGWFAAHGTARTGIRHLFRSFNAGAEAFRREGEAHDPHGHGAG